MKTTADNDHNFVKAFTVFGVGNDNIALSNEADDVVEAIVLFDILSTSNKNMHYEDYNGVWLTPHFRCAIHTLDLVVSKDIETYFKDKKQFNKTDKYFNQLKRLYRKVLSKCQKSWNK